MDFSKFSDVQLNRMAKLLEIKDTRVHFAKNCHRNTSGEKLEWTRFRHMIDLYNSVAAKIVIMGASQTGKTDWLIIDTLAAAYNNVATFFVLPKYDFLKAYVKEKVKTPIARSPEYKLLNKDSLSEAIELLQFGSAFIKFVGGNVPSDFVSFSAGQYCLGEGTLVDTALGKIPIEKLPDFVDLDIIRCRDFQTGKDVYGKLTSWVQLPPKPAYRYHFDNGEFLDATDDHRVYSGDGWIPIGLAASGRKAISSPKTVKIVAVEYLGERIVCDINVANHHNFYANGILTHNCIDEIDKCDSEDNIEMGYSRISASDYKFERIVSNPTTTNGRIWREYQNSDQRVWVCPCSKCGKFNQLGWFESIVREVEDESGNVISHVLRDTEWSPGCGRDVDIKCPEEDCDGNLDRFAPSCRWHPQNPDSHIEGYHMPSLVSPLNSVAEGWIKYREGLSNPSKMSFFYSMFLALPYAPVGSKVSSGLLERCSANPKQQYTVKILPDHACLWEETHPGPCSMGIDVAPSHIDIRISCNFHGKRKLVYVGKLNISEISSAAVEAQLHLLVEQYNVQCAVIDIGPDKLLSLDFQSNAKCPVWLCKFLGRGEDRLMKYNYNDTLISIDRTEALDRAYAQLKTGKNLLPTNYASILQGAYVSEMTALVREVTEDAKGNLKYSWTKGNDHAFLADAYDILAWEILQEDVLCGEDSVFIA